MTSLTVKVLLAKLEQDVEGLPPYRYISVCVMLETVYIRTKELILLILNRMYKIRSQIASDHV